MELSAHSLSHVKLPKPLSSSSPFSPSIFSCKSSSRASQFPSFQSPKSYSHQPQSVKIERHEYEQRRLTSIRASETEAPSSDDAERWLLVPVGDGDSTHLGFKVEMPDAFEIASNEVTVGRLPEKADVVIPVATVSGLHARLQKKEGNLLVTDLDSTNGTYIDDRRLKPGVAAAVPSGSCIIFGDVHLAMYKVSKLKNAEAQEKSEGKQEAEGPDLSSETS